MTTKPTNEKGVKCIVCASQESVGTVECLDGERKHVCFDCYTTGKLRDFEHLPTQMTNESFYNQEPTNERSATPQHAIGAYEKLYDKLYAEYQKLLKENTELRGSITASHVEAKHDPSFEVPTEVLKAALIIENYTQQNRIIDWEIGGTASRKLVHKLYDQNQELKGILTTLQSERDQLKKALEDLNVRYRELQTKENDLYQKYDDQFTELQSLKLKGK